jgi:hypothetical protein
MTPAQAASMSKCCVPTKRLMPVDEPVPKNRHPKPRPVRAVESHKTAAPSIIGQIYTIAGDSGNLNFTLDSLELAADRYKLGDHDNEYPKVDEKLLVIHFTLENPGSTDVAVDGGSVRFLARDAERKLYADAPKAADENTGDLVGGNLPAGGKIDAVKVIHVPAKGPIVALKVTPGPVGVEPFEFLLLGHVPKLSAPFADPKDTTGMTALDTFPAEIGQTYAVGDCDLTLQKAEFTDEPLLNFKGVTGPVRGYHFAVFTFDVVAQVSDGLTFSTDKFNPTLTTEDGLAVDPVSGPLLRGSTDEPFDGNVQYGDDQHFRIYYPVSVHDRLATLTVQATPTSHKVSYDLTSMQPKSDTQ